MNAENWILPETRDSGRIDIGTSLLLKGTERRRNQSAFASFPVDELHIRSGKVSSFIGLTILNGFLLVKSWHGFTRCCFSRWVDLLEGTLEGLFEGRPVLICVFLRCAATRTLDVWGKLSYHTMVEIKTGTSVIVRLSLWIFFCTEHFFNIFWMHVMLTVALQWFCTAITHWLLYLPANATS